MTDTQEVRASSLVFQIILNAARGTAVAHRRASRFEDAQTIEACIHAVGRQVGLTKRDWEQPHFQPPLES